MTGAGSRRPSKISDEALRAAVPEAINLRQLLLALGVAPYGGNYEVVRDRLRALGLDDERFRRRPPRAARVLVTTEEVQRCVPLAVSYAHLARLLELGTSTRAQVRAKRLAIASGQDLSHLLGRASNRGVRRGGREPEPLDAVLVVGRRIATSSLRRRLIAEGVLPATCSECGLGEWQGQPIPLELDHVNGDREDNRLDNLRLLCPNCHAQTATYRGRNIGDLGGQPSRTALLRDRRRADARARAARRLDLVLADSAPYGDVDGPP